MSKKLSGLWKVIQASQKAKIILACTSVVAVGGVGAVSYDAYINKKAEVSKANKTYIEQSVSNENENKENELIEKKDIVDPNKVDSDSNSKTDSKSKNNSSNSKTDSKSKNNSSNSKTDSKSKNNSSNSKTDNKSNNNSSNSKTDNKSNNNSSNSKPDTKPDTKPEPKPDTKPEPKPDTKPEPKPDTKPEPKPDTKPEPKPDTKPEPKPDTKPEPKPEPKPDTKPEPKPDTKPEVIPNGYNSEMTNFVNSSILNRYSGTKYAYFNSLLSDLGRGIKSKSQVESILQGYEWEEKGANYLGKVARVTVQSYDVVGNDKEKIGVNIQAGNYRYWKGVVYADNGVNKVAIIGIVINDIIFE